MATSHRPLTVPEARGTDPERAPTHADPPRTDGCRWVVYDVIGVQRARRWPRRDDADVSTALEGGSDVIGRASDPLTPSTQLPSSAAAVGVLVTALGVSAAQAAFAEPADRSVVDERRGLILTEEDDCFETGDRRPVRLSDAQSYVPDRYV